jgi:hypothetical protein
VVCCLPALAAAAAAARQMQLVLVAQLLRLPWLLLLAQLSHV